MAVLVSLLKVAIVVFPVVPITGTKLGVMEIVLDDFGLNVSCVVMYFNFSKFNNRWMESLKASVSYSRR